MINLIYKDIKELINNKKIIIISVLLPLIILIMVSFIYTKTYETKGSGINVGIIDNDNSFFSKLIVGYFKESGDSLGYFAVVEGESWEIEKNFKAGVIDAYLTLPKDFAYNMQRMEHEPIQVVINSSNSLNSIIIKNVTKGYEKYIEAIEVGIMSLYHTMESDFQKKEIEDANVSISYSLVYTAVEREDFFEYIEVHDVFKTSLVNYYIFSFLSLIVMYGGLYAGMNMLKEKDCNTLGRLITTGTSTLKIVSSKIMVNSVFIYILVLPCYITGTIITKSDFRILTSFFILTSILFSSGLSVMVSGFINSQEGMLLGGNMACFIAVILGGSIIPIEYLPDSITVFSQFMPNYWFVKIILGIESGLIQDFVVGIIVAVLSTFVFIIISAYVYLGKKVGKVYDNSFFNAK